MQLLWKNPVISNVAKHAKYCPKSHSLLSINKSIIHLNQFSFCASTKDQKTELSSTPSPESKVNGTDMSQRMLDLDRELPGKPEFMQDDYDEYQELEVLGLHDTVIKSKHAPDSRVFNPEYDPDYDPDAEDQIEVGAKKKDQPQHRIIKSTVKEDVVIEMEGISTTERIYTWLLLGCAVYAGMLTVRFLFMKDKLKKEREEMLREREEMTVVQTS